MKFPRILFAAMLASTCATPALAQSTFPTRAANVRTGGTVILTCDANDANCRPVTSASPMPIDAGSGASASQIQGNAPSGATDTGNPVKIGGVANVNLPTAASTGQRVNAWYAPRGQAVVVPAIGIAYGDGVPNNETYIGGMMATDGMGRLSGTASWIFNGSQWDRAPGTSSGSFVIGKGGSGIATGQVSIGTTATLIAAARPGRQNIQIIVGAANSCALGNAGVTLTTGYLLPTVAGTTDTSITAASLYAVCSAATTISFKELF